LAAWNGHTGIVELLLAAGADVNIQRKVCTSLQPSSLSHRVCHGCGCAWREGEAWWRRRQSGGTRLTRHPLTGFVVCGVQYERTPLHKAAEYGHKAIVEALLAAGADVHVRDNVCTSLPPSAHPLTVSATCVCG
jgi:hypothetical protein